MRNFVLLMVLGFFFFGSVFSSSAKEYTFCARDGSTIKIFAKNSKINVIDQTSRSRIKPLTEQLPCGYAICKGQPPMILQWYPCYSGGKTARIWSCQFEWDGRNYVPKKKNMTDHAWRRNQDKEILRELSKSNSEFLRFFAQLQDWVKKNTTNTDVKRLKSKKLSTLNFWWAGRGTFVYKEGSLEIMVQDGNIW